MKHVLTLPWLALLTLAASSLAADDWGSLATTSNTAAGYLCDITDDGRDLDCTLPNPVVDGSGNVGINISGTSPSRTLTVSGTAWTRILELDRITGAAVPVSLTTGGGGGSADNLGNHTASETLVMGGNDIDAAGLIAAEAVSATNLYGFDISGTSAHFAEICDETGNNCSNVSDGLGARFLTSLTDVSVTSPASGSVLQFVGSSNRWEAMAVTSLISSSMVYFDALSNGAESIDTSFPGQALTQFTELVDSHGAFSSGTFTAPEAGYYLFRAQVVADDLNTSHYVEAQLSINGTLKGRNWAYSPATGRDTSVEIVWADYLPASGTAQLLARVSSGTYDTQSFRFTGALISPGAAGENGGSTPGGTNTQVQFNDGGSALGGSANFTWDNAEDLLTVAGTVSATNVYGLAVSGTEGYFPTATISSLSGGAIAANSVSSTLVSASHISATYLQLNSPTTVLACGSGMTGAMRYTSGTMQVCDGAEWGNVGIGVPTGTIAAFAAASCPSGWSEYTPARGRFLRGIDILAAGIDPDGTRAAGNIQGDSFQGHWHQAYVDLTNREGQNSGNTYFAWRGDSGGFNTQANDNGGDSMTRQAISDGNNGTPRISTETRPKNVAVIFCQYAGYDSSMAVGVATLASLSDVSVGGATNGDALVYDNGTWVPGAGGGSDNLGNHTASQTLVMAGYDITGAGEISASSVKVGGQDSCSTVADLGRIRRDPATGKMQVCR